MEIKKHSWIKKDVISSKDASLKDQSTSYSVTGDPLVIQKYNNVVMFHIYTFTCKLTIQNQFCFCRIAHFIP